MDRPGRNAGCHSGSRSPARQARRCESRRHHHPPGSGGPVDRYPGQPGSVGPADCTPYLADARTRSNHDQPKPDDHGQLTSFLAGAAKSLGIAYDWVGIAEDALGALQVPDLASQIDGLWRWPSDHNLLPGHVVCSSLAAALSGLASVGWAHPDLGAERQCEPADWWQWSNSRSWQTGS